MNDSARVILTGRLGRDPETRYTANGAMNVSFSMAVSRTWTTQAGAEGSNTTWFKVTAWRDLAAQLDRLPQADQIREHRHRYDRDIQRLRADRDLGPHRRAIGEPFTTITAR